VVELSIIIINWNVRDFLGDCLDSLDNSISKMSHEIFVVDNNSSDGSVAMLKEQFPTVSLMINKENIGFGKANNQAIRKSSGEFILLLNPDTIVVNDGINRMLEYLRQNPQIGAIGPKILNSDHSIQKSCFRKYPSLKREFFALMRLDRFLLKPITSVPAHEFNKPGPAEVLSGSAMLVRSTCLKEIGGFDEQFFMYAEDIDLCLQIRKKGWLLSYYPDATIKHFGHKSSKKSEDFSPFAVACGSLYKYFKKNRSFPAAFMYRIMVLFASLLWIVIYTITFQFLKKKPKSQLSLYHDYQKLKWAATSKIKWEPSK